MLSKAKTLKGYALEGIDANVGSVKEFYFDDRHWTVRYLVADTGTWLTERQVLISPYALTSVLPSREHISVNLTKKQIEESPDLDHDKPVSRQFEESYYMYYGWPTYWNGPYPWGTYPYLLRPTSNAYQNTEGDLAWDPNLRSTHDVTGHYIQAMDGEIGHVEDFVIDDESWTIRYIIVNTQNWWPGKRILVSPQWIDRISWSESKVFVNLTKESIMNSPEFTDESLQSRDYEEGLHRHYDREGYWVGDRTPKEFTNKG